MKEFVEIPEAPKVEPAGMITIEVTDAETGDLVAKEEKHNFVQERMLRAISKFAAHMPFSLRTHNIEDQLINGIELTDYAGAPAPDIENYVQGNLIGFGVKDNAASGTNRGAWNAVESVIRTDYVKLVFDFATSQGNGTFQSIYTKKFIQPSDPGYNWGPTLLPTMSWPFQWHRVRKAGNALYFWSSSDLKKLYKVSLFDLKLDYTTSTAVFAGNYETFTFLTDFAQNNVIRGNEIFKILSNKVQKATISPPGPFVDVFTVPFACSNLAYHEGTDRFYIEKNVSQDYVVYEYSSAFALIKVLDVGKASSSLNRVTDDGKFIVKNGQLFEIATGRMQYLGQSASSNYMVYEGVELGDYFLGESSYNRSRITPSPQFFSRVLLDSPVTKTAQQNMKITYEFTIPPLKIFGA